MPDAAVSRDGAASVRAALCLRVLFLKTTYFLGESSFEYAFYAGYVAIGSCRSNAHRVSGSNYCFSECRNRHSSRRQDTSDGLNHEALSTQASVTSEGDVPLPLIREREVCVGD